MKVELKTLDKKVFHVDLDIESTTTEQLKEIAETTCGLAAVSLLATPMCSSIKASVLSILSAFKRSSRLPLSFPSSLFSVTVSCLFVGYRWSADLRWQGVLLRVASFGKAEAREGY